MATDKEQLSLMSSLSSSLSQVSSVSSPVSFGHQMFKHPYTVCLTKDWFAQLFAHPSTHAACVCDKGQLFQSHQRGQPDCYHPDHHPGHPGHPHHHLTVILVILTVILVISIILIPLFFILLLFLLCLLSITAVT